MGVVTTKVPSSPRFFRGQGPNSLGAPAPRPSWCPSSATNPATSSQPSDPDDSPASVDGDSPKINGSKLSKEYAICWGWWPWDDFETYPSWVRKIGRTQFLSGATFERENCRSENTKRCRNLSKHWGKCENCYSGEKTLGKHRSGASPTSQAASAVHAGCGPPRYVEETNDWKLEFPKKTIPSFWGRFKTLQEKFLQLKNKW